MTDEWIYKNKFLIPFSIRIFLILHSKESSDRNVIVINYFLKPFGIHNYNFLSTLIYNLLFFDIFERSSLNSSKCALRNYYGFDFYVLLNG